MDGVTVPAVTGCRTDGIYDPLMRWKRANPGVQIGWFVKQALWEKLERQGFTGKRDKRPV